MIIYIIKTIICSALLLTVYLLLLEKEKMHRFNRFYLLFSLVFSYTVPLVTFSTEQQVFPAADTIEFVRTNIHETLVEPPQVLPTQEINYLPLLLTIAYLTVSGFLLFRFIRNIAALILGIRRHSAVAYSNARLILLNSNLPTHSFFKYIFVSKQDRSNGATDKKILCHELAHVKQYHSIDILLLEVLMIIAWINPLLYFYKKSIQLNHEFLADEKVVATYNDVSSYQQLLLNTITTSTNYSLVSSLNYSLTKKRFLMMSKRTSSAIAAAKQMIALVVLAACLFTFSTRTIAQVQEPKPRKQDKPVASERSKAKQTDSFRAIWLGMSIGHTEEGVSPELMDEYEIIVAKYKTAENWFENIFKNITPADRNRLEEIYKQMNPEQQNKQAVGFIKPQKPLPKNVPTSKEFESWKNARIYGVWIDEKRVSNQVLNNYSNSDFSHVFVSKLGKNTVNYGKHYYQVNLMTNEYYKDYYNKAKARTENQLVIRHYVEKVK